MDDVYEKREGDYLNLSLLQQVLAQMSVLLDVEDFFDIFRQESDIQQQRPKPRCRINITSRHHFTDLIVSVHFSLAEKINFR